MNSLVSQVVRLIAQRKEARLIALLLCAALFSAHSAFAASGYVDFSDFNLLGGSLTSLMLYVAALGCVAALAFGIFKLAGRDFMTGIISVVLALVGGIIVGHALGWTAAITGVSVTAQ